jgi:hypothetical protein
MRRVPSHMSVVRKLDQNAVEILIQLTLDQAKARGHPISDLEGYYDDLRVIYRDFEESLRRIMASGSPSHPTFSFWLLGDREIDRDFRNLIFLAYLLGSSSPDPYTKKGFVEWKRTAKAIKARKKGWEEPVEEVIARAFEAAGPNFPEDKDIFKMVHDEMDRRGIKITVGDEALRKRIRPHRKDAERDAEIRSKASRGGAG